MKQAIEKTETIIKDKEVLSIKELSIYFGISESQLRRLVKEKKIPFLKLYGLYKFFLPSVRKWLSEVSSIPQVESIVDDTQEKTLEIWKSTVEK